MVRHKSHSTIRLEFPRLAPCELPPYLPSGLCTARGLAWKSPLIENVEEEKKE